MKKTIHPKYYPNATTKCSCGQTFQIGATVELMKVDLCSACHPFYTGKQKLVDTAGRVDRFRARQAAATTKKTVKKEEKIKTTAKVEKGAKKEKAVKEKKTKK